jgi:hypothetical protein
MPNDYAALTKGKEIELELDSIPLRETIACLRGLGFNIDSVEALDPDSPTGEYRVLFPVPDEGTAVRIIKRGKE